MILILSMKNEKKFLISLFDKNSPLMKALFNLIKLSKCYYRDIKKKNDKISKILCNLFFSEYKEIFLKNQLEELFIINHEKFSKINVECLDVYPPIVYESLFDFLLDFNFDYKYLELPTKSSKDQSFEREIEDKYSGKILFKL